MLPKPAGFGQQYASAFQECGVAAAYQHRPPYPPETFSALASLIASSPRSVLDVGCGTGAIARHLVESVDRVDAVDVSPAMIEQGKRAPHGDHPRLNWIAGRAEEVPLAPPYALIAAGDSLHWMDWEVVMPRFARLLAPQGLLVILQNGQLPPPWDGELVQIIQQYSTNQDYRPVDLVAELERRGLFQKHGALQTAPIPFRQSIDAYIESFHGRASFSRERMTAQAAVEFDAKTRALVSAFCHDIVELQLVADIVWGKPRLLEIKD